MSPSAIAYAELATATLQFDPSRIVGRGVFAPVYRGELCRGQSVAIKKFPFASENSGEAAKEFQLEVQLLSMCRHENIVPLVAFSMEPINPLCLVHLFLSGGALSDALRNPRRRALIGAVHRARIAADVASGLRYLHTELRVVHRAVKSANILLDADSRARLGNLRLARDVDLRRRIVALGSPGYLDPETRSTFKLTAGSDIFSFGVVILELLTSAPAVDPALQPPALSARLRDRIPDAAADVADALAFADGDVAPRLAALAKRSIAPTSDARPTAAELAEALEVLHADARDASCLPPGSSQGLPGMF